MDLPDLYWAAGFLEGEGCFSGSITKGYPAHSIVVGQKDPECLYKLSELFGGRVRQRKPQGFTSNGLFIWQVSGAAARGLMMTLYTVLSSRRKEAIKQALALKPNKPYVRGRKVLLNV